MSDDLVTWLRERIESDLSEWRVREAHFLAGREREGDYHYFEARERVARCEAELAILDLYEQQAAKDNNAMEEDRTWLLARVVRLLATGYRHRTGYREEWKPWATT